MMDDKRISALRKERGSGLVWAVIDHTPAEFWEALDEIEKLRETIARMQDWIEGDCFCPCCEQIRECLPSCTFAKDWPTVFEGMAGARAVLYGPTKQQDGG